MDREYIRQAFASYTANYDPEDPKIRLKIDHTYRVADLCERISTEAGTDPDLSWLMGMLHDIGRFEQVRRYHTFFDSQSVDHAAFGADLLFQEGLLSRFGGFISGQKQILETSIRCHSLYRLPPMDERMKAYCTVLRDADKIDILRVNHDIPLEDIYNVTTQELRTSSVTEEVRQCFIEKHAVLRSLKKTPVDNLVGHICLYFELEYPVSRKIVMEQGYLNKLLDFKSENPGTQRWFSYMRENLNE